MKYILTLLLTASLSVALFAQKGPNGVQVAAGTANQGAAQPATAPNRTLDPASIVIITGIVTKVNLATGVQNPSIVIDGKTIELAPVWWMIERGMEIKEGDNLEVKAAPCLDPNKPWLYAIEVNNITTGTTLTLRDDSGLPFGSAAEIRPAASRLAQLQAPAWPMARVALIRRRW